MDTIWRRRGEPPKLEPYRDHGSFRAHLGEPRPPVPWKTKSVILEKQAAPLPAKHHWLGHHNRGMTAIAVPHQYSVIRNSTSPHGGLFETAITDSTTWHLAVNLHPLPPAQVISCRCR